MFLSHDTQYSAELKLVAKESQGYRNVHTRVHIELYNQCKLTFECVETSYKARP